MPSNKKKRGNNKKERKTASARAPPPAQQKDLPSEGEAIFANAVRNDPKKMADYISMMEQSGYSKEDAVAEMITSLQFRSDQEEGRLPKGAFDDKDKTCDRDGCETKGEFLCVGCHCHYYCGMECQRIAWRTLGHKQQCKALNKCLMIASMPRCLAMNDQTTFGVVRTKHYGNHVYCMEQYTVVGDEMDRLVPLASVEFDGESPTYAQVSSCLVNAILHPDFDTKCAGARRPCNISIHSKSFGSSSVAEHLAAVCHRLGILVASMGASVDNDEWESSWFCVQQGWTDEIDNDAFLKAIPTCRLHPMSLNGSVRKEELQLAEEYNKHALATASSPPNLVSLRKKVMRLPYEQEQPTALSFQRKTIGTAVVKGVLYVLELPNLQLLHQGRLVLDTTTNRPPADYVLAAIFKVLIARKSRPPMLYLGHPSICSHQDVDRYEDALDESVVRDNCSLALLGSMESAVETALVQWRAMGMELLVDEA